MELGARMQEVLVRSEARGGVANNYSDDVRFRGRETQVSKVYRFADTSGKLRLLLSLPRKQKQELSLTGKQNRSFAYRCFAKKKGALLS
jgi:hypothetical protein